jgi:hypothetical protein
MRERAGGMRILRGGDQTVPAARGAFEFLEEG